jgi:predicted ATPase
MNEEIKLHFLHKIFIPNTNFPDEFPFTLPVFAGGINLDFRTNVTFFVGENGSGKSKLLPIKIT